MDGGFSWTVAASVGIAACVLYNLARFTRIVIPLWLVTLWWLGSYLTHDFSPAAFAEVRHCLGFASPSENMPASCHPFQFGWADCSDCSRCVIDAVSTKA